MELNIQTAELALREAAESNPGAWAEHSRYVAEACKNIALHCKDLSSEQAYIFGLLHDIGRYAGVSSERHLIDGYRYCMERGWGKAAQICISHAFMIQDIATSIGEFDVSDEDYLFMKEFVANAVYDDYDRLVQLCDALAMPSGFCLLEKRFVDVTMRYGVHPATIDRWKKILEIKERFEDQIGCSIYALLPALWKTVFVKGDIVYYGSSDFLETADSDTLKQIARTRELTRKYYFPDYGDIEKRTSILRELLGGIGENVLIDTPFHCDYGKNIFLGNDVIINMNCTFVDNKTIRIGDRVLIASNVQIYTSTHPVLPQERFVPDWRERQTTFFRTYARPIEIESNVWIGGGCILLPGVTIGKNSVIGAESVVTRPVPPNCVAVGNPCRVIRYFDTGRERWQHEV